MKLEKKCECGSKGELQEDMKSWYDEKLELPFVNHLPNKCKCVNKLKKYMRGNKVLYLCSCCFLSSDVEQKE